MLVLTRKEGQRIVIGGNIVVDIVQLRGNRVRVGISAPPETGIVRGELIDDSATSASGPPAIQDAGLAASNRLLPTVARVA